MHGQLVPSPYTPFFRVLFWKLKGEKIEKNNLKILVRKTQKKKNIYPHPTQPATAQTHLHEKKRKKKNIGGIELFFLGFGKRGTRNKRLIGMDKKISIFSSLRNFTVICSTPCAGTSRGVRQGLCFVKFWASTSADLTHFLWATLALQIIGLLCLMSDNGWVQKHGKTALYLAFAFKKEKLNNIFNDDLFPMPCSCSLGGFCVVELGVGIGTY